MEGGKVMNYGEMIETFDALNAQQKAVFMDARLAWASNGGLCGEMRLRLCGPHWEGDKHETEIRNERDGNP